MPRFPWLPSICALVLLTACGGGGDSPADAPPAGGVCSDGLDNDGDGSTDYPADPGCDDAADNDESNAPVAMCSDGRDNDADGQVDYPDDPGCFSPLQDSEADDCPTGPTCPACANGADDDGDGQADYPNDTGCSAASDDDEWETNPMACGPNLVVTRLEAHDVTGTLPASPSNLTSGTCGGAGGEVAYEVVVTDPSVIVASTDDAATTADTVLYLRTDCQAAATELGCNDNISNDTTRSRLTASVAPGVYYLVIDAKTAAAAGAFKLHVDLLAGEGVPCTDQAQCGPGLQCRVPLGETEMVCADPVCSDAADDDGDGANDYPDDPGCDSPGDFDEADTCPSGASCPACANDLDDDGDGQIDFPADTDCSSASQPVEGCGVEQDPIFTISAAASTGTLVGLHDDFDLACGIGGGADQVYFITLPHMQRLQLDTEGTATDTVLGLYPSTCSGAGLGCDDDGGTSAGASLLVKNNLAAGAYAIVVAGYSSAVGPYNLNVSGTIAAGGACDGALATAGVIGCGADYACVSGVCTGNLACNNGVDDDGDGHADYPDDPGCESTTDTDETDDCPSGPTCPVCSNGLDDDGDGQTDYPADPDCDAAGGAAETCGVESDPLIAMTTPTVSGMTTGATADFTLSCGASGSSPDRVAMVTVPKLRSLHLDMAGSDYDAVLALKTPDCGPSDLACDDAIADGGEVIDYAPGGGIAAGTYAIIIDGYFGSTGNYDVNLTGIIATNGRCDGALATAGALTCATGFACKGPVGNKTCKKAQCNDGNNNADGDALVDYPNDPGCTSISDDSEADDCPSGPGCPACGNGADDDGDGLTDYPADFGCAAASGTTEAACAGETDTIQVIDTAVENGTTVGKANDFLPSCAAGSNAPDVTYILQVPVGLATLSIDTETTPFNTTLTIDEPTCAAPPIACDDNGGATGTSSKIVLSDVTAGAYAITVDAANAASGAYALHVDGRAVPGAACTSPLFAAGVLSCGVGENCVAGTCQ